MDLTDTPGFVPGFPLTMNLRELGGLRAADGRRVRRGIFYRGSALAELTAEQRALVDAMELSCIFDLRARREAELAPDYVPEGTRYRRISGMYFIDGSDVDFAPGSFEQLREQIDEPERLMEIFYTSMVHENPATHALVDRLVKKDVPLYFHCSAGKDRTGISAALILTILGVPDEVIMEDFLLTNIYRAEFMDNPPEVLPYGMDESAWKRANGVVEEGLQAVFDVMDGEHGSREQYLFDEFGLSADDLADLRDLYLE